ncbi:DUF5797 family protein [Haloplanus pelagicus]|jgi:hypothetical protein|uniref:DUF5797 family protein n=1 Tax=Haloplanus pelagicus TaxID=2949995 RepID=UPI0020404A87|nr:DUF5797 family protein [Haloplanus sp. HW8-1]
MTSPLFELDEDEIRPRTKKQVQKLIGDTSGEFYIYVLECQSEISLRRPLVGFDGKAIQNAVQAGEDSWLELPAKIRPPMGGHESNFPKWVEQAVEADEVYYVGQTRDPVNRIVEHATAGEKSANATRLFPPKSLIHIEAADSWEEANALEDLISDFITFGCEIESQNYTDYGKIPERISDRLMTFANSDSMGLEIENGRNIRSFHAAPNDYWTANLLYHLRELPFKIDGWEVAEEFDIYPIKESIVVDWYLTSVEVTAENETSFQYQEDLLLSQIDAFEQWLESSQEYPSRGDSESAEWEADEGINSTEEAQYLFEELMEIGEGRIIQPFLEKYRNRTRELHPSPLRFAYSDKTPNLAVESDGKIPAEEAEKIAKAQHSSKNDDDDTRELSDREISRLQDVIELSPTSNGELQNRWGLDDSADVHHYLESHLSEWYYRDSESRIQVTEDAEEVV